MKAKTKILKFLQAKNNLIFQTTGLRYIYLKDLEYIDNLSTADADMIWDSITRMIYNRSADRTQGLCANACPWCISKELTIINGCDECSYATNHGKCYRSKVSQKFYASGYDMVHWYLIDKKINHNELLSNKWYKQLIKSIEQK